jgi:hypothetical protein
MISPDGIMEYIKKTSLDQETIDILYRARTTIVELRQANERLRRENNALSLDLGFYENGYTKKGIY